MKVKVILSGLTFGGRVYKEGDVIDSDRVSNFPFFALEPNFRDDKGRQWFKLINKIKKPIIPALKIEEKTKDSLDENKMEVKEKKPLICETCGKEYKNEKSYLKHVEKCK